MSQQKNRQLSKKEIILGVTFLIVVLNLVIAAVVMTVRQQSDAQWMQMRHQGQSATARSNAVKVSASSQAIASDQSRKTTRTVYPYSVIRGGIANADELKRAALQDGTVASHFSGFNLAKARVVELPSEKMAYVSYRVQDKVYWTKKKVRLAKGEKVVTDGVNTARARCGNQISEIPQSPTHPQEPPVAVLDTPDDPLMAALPDYRPLPPPLGMEVTPQTGLFSTANLIPDNHSRGRWFIPALMAPAYVAGRDRDKNINPPPPPVNVPEPSTFILLASGLAGLLVFGRLWKK